MLVLATQNTRTLQSCSFQVLISAMATLTPVKINLAWETVHFEAFVIYLSHGKYKVSHGTQRLDSSQHGPTTSNDSRRPITNHCPANEPPSDQNLRY